jgi:hypothetical protein
LGVSGVGTVAGVAVLAGSIGAGAGTEALIRKLYLKDESTTPPKVKPKVPTVPTSKSSPPPKTEPVMSTGDYTPEELQQLETIQNRYGSQSSVSEPAVVASVNRNISDGLDGPTTYGSQGMIKSREVVIAIQPVEVPA